MFIFFLQVINLIPVSSKNIFVVQVPFQLSCTAMNITGAGFIRQGARCHKLKRGPFLLGGGSGSLATGKVLQLQIVTGEFVHIICNDIWLIGAGLRRPQQGTPF